MCGMFFVLFCVGAAAFAWRRRRRYAWACGHGGHWGYGGDGCGGSPWHRHGGDSWSEHHERAHRSYGSRGRGWGGYAARGLAAGLAEAVLATPEQERVIANALIKMADAKEAVRGQLGGARAHAAKAFRDDDMNEEMLGVAIAEADGALEELRRAIVDAMVEVHGSLDRGQRERFARWIEQSRGPFGPLADRGRHH